MRSPRPVFSPSARSPQDANVFGRIAYASARHASVVIATYVLIASIALAYTIARLEINTDQTQMISRHLDFRKVFADFVDTFPELSNTFVVIVDSDEPELGREAARSLELSFSARPDLFENVYSPGTSTFFDTYGMLYLPVREIRKIVTQIGGSAPLLKALANQPNLIGLSRIFAELRQGADRGVLPATLEPLLAEISRTATAELAGQPQPLDCLLYTSDAADE